MNEKWKDIYCKDCDKFLGFSVKLPKMFCKPCIEHRGYELDVGDLEGTVDD